MCEYCEEISNPISFPKTFTLNNGNKITVIHGLHIKKSKKRTKMEFFEKYEDNTKFILFERNINYCPFCGKKL